MTREKLREILLKHYKTGTSIFPYLRDPKEKGFKRPRWDKIIKMQKEDNIPVQAWVNIVNWLKEEAEEGETLTEKAS